MEKDWQYKQTLNSIFVHISTLAADLDTQRMEFHVCASEGAKRVTLANDKAVHSFFQECKIVNIICTGDCLSFCTSINT